jgi:hypothetical protein
MEEESFGNLVATSDRGSVPHAEQDPEDERASAYHPMQQALAAQRQEGSDTGEHRTSVRR